MQKIKSFIINIWERVTDGQRGSVIDAIKIVISWMVIFWHAVSSQLNALFNNQNVEKEDR